MTTEQERQKAIKTLAEMIQKIRVAMLTTAMPDGTLRSRPMVAAEHEFDGELWFFTETTSSKVAEGEGGGQVNVSFASPQDKRYVSLSGTAEFTRAPQKIEILWKPNYAVWFPNEIEPEHLGFLKVVIERAEYWDSSSSRMVQIAGFAKALFGCAQPHPAEHGEIQWPQPEDSANVPQHANQSL